MSFEFFAQKKIVSFVVNSWDFMNEFQTLWIWIMLYCPGKNISRIAKIWNLFSIVVLASKAIAETRWTNCFATILPSHTAELVIYKSHYWDIHWVRTNNRMILHLSDICFVKYFQKSPKGITVLSQMIQLIKVEFNENVFCVL